MQAERYIAAVDLGTSKVAVSVAKIDGGDAQLIYYKETPSDGINYSYIFNPTRAAAPVKAAVQAAEEELNIKILQVVVGLPRYKVHQETARARIDRTDPTTCITHDEISTLKNIAIECYPLSDDNNEEIYGAVAQSFSADEDLVGATENDVVGVTSATIEGTFKIFVGTSKAINNLDTMMNKTGVALARSFFVPSIVAKSVLTESEKENGVALVEMGAGVTSLTIYKDGLLRHYSAIPFGGNIITRDIKSECGFTERLAENIKLAYGACLSDRLQSLGEKILQINDEDNGTHDQLPIKYLSEVITSRAREIIDAILYQIQDSGYADRLRGGIVITGGGAMLVNLGMLLKEMSGYNVRVGYPRSKAINLSSCPEASEASAAASIGLILEAAKDSHLNCIEGVVKEHIDAQAEAAEGSESVSASATEGAKAEEPQGSLFSDDEVLIPKKNKEKQKKDKGGSGKVRWEKLRQKVTSGLEKTFDNTLGSLFEGMQ